MKGMENKMNEVEKYAVQWNISAQYFYEQGYYSWMSENLNGCKSVLEIGCGTGYSTLALAEKGFKVLAIDKNSNCIAKAKELLSSKGFQDDQVIFIEGDVAEDSFRKRLIENYSFEIVVCWNVGTYWGKEMFQYYLPHMLEYGLDVGQIKANPESSYSELIIWEACRIAKAKNTPIHIVDRGGEIINEQTDPYYSMLKNEFEYSEILYDNLQAESISGGGRVLTTNGTVNMDNKIDIVFVSIFMC